MISKIFYTRFNEKNMKKVQLTSSSKLWPAEMVNISKSFLQRILETKDTLPAFPIKFASSLISNGTEDLLLRLCLVLDNILSRTKG